MRRSSAPRPVSSARSVGRARSRSSGRLVGDRRLDVEGNSHAQKIDAAPVGTQDSKLKSADPGGFTAAGQPAELLHEQAADGVVFFIGKGSGKKFIEIGDRRQRAHREFPRTFLPNRLIILDLMLLFHLPPYFSAAIP